jgi:hypothetical protein
MKKIIKKLNEQTVSPNGLVYTEEIIKEIYNQVKDRELIGEFGQDSNRPKKEVVNLMNASLISKNYMIEDGNLVADIKFIGDKKDLSENGLIDYEFGIRALTKNNSMEVKDLKVITFDLIQK